MELIIANNGSLLYGLLNLIILMEGAAFVVLIWKTQFNYNLQSLHCMLNHTIHNKLYIRLQTIINHIDKIPKPYNATLVYRNLATA